MTQVEKLQKEMTRIEKDITQNDKKLCHAKTKLHPNTIKMYIAGEGKDADTAVKLLTFFKKQIEKRNKVLA